MKKAILTLTMLTALTGCASDGTEVRAESGDDGASGFIPHSASHYSPLSLACYVSRISGNK